jgi:DNA-binding transcriptional ArsR family regulator
MVNRSSARLDRVFSALGDPTRRAILKRLAHGGATISELAEPLPMSLPAVSKHLRILEAAGLIQRRKLGRVHHVRLTAAAMHEAAEWLEQYRQYWEGQFDSLAAYLARRPDE